MLLLLILLLRLSAEGENNVGQMFQPSAPGCCGASDLVNTFSRSQKLVRLPFFLCVCVSIFSLWICVILTPHPLLPFPFLLTFYFNRSRSLTFFQCGYLISPSIQTPLRSILERTQPQLIILWTAAAAAAVLIITYV